MVLRRRFQNYRTVTTLGLVCLAIAIFSRWYLHPTATLSPDRVDGIEGLLYGISIGLLLWAVYLRAHPHSVSRTSPGAD